MKARTRKPGAVAIYALNTKPDATAGKLLESLLASGKIRKLRERSDDATDMNHIVTGENFNCLMRELREGEALAIVYRQPLATWGIGAIESREDYAFLKQGEALAALLYQYWVAVPQDRLREIIGLASPHNRSAQREREALAVA